VVRGDEGGGADGRVFVDNGGFEEAFYALCH
jgi:hypothetical protein